MKSSREKILFCLLLLLSLAFGLSACAGDKTEEPVLATDLVDGTVTPEASVTFRVSAFVGDRTVIPEVTCNGVLLSENEGTYTTALRKGQNEIDIRVIDKAFALERKYTLFRKADFAISTDIDEEPIVNNEISFTASALFNGAPCALIVTHNGTVLTDDDGRYRATLAVGDNRFVLTARAGNYTTTEEKQITYDGFRFITDAKDTVTADGIFSFRAAASYGNVSCDLAVTVGGVPVSPDGTRYTISLAAGDNRIVLTATHGRATAAFTCTVRYADGAPTLSVGIRDRQTYRGDRYSFDLVARDALGEKLPASAVSFFLDKDAGDDIENFIRTDAVFLVWDDSTMTSFCLRFTEEPFASLAGVPFLLKITATDGRGRTASATYTLTYAPAAEGESVGDVIFAMEGFSIGCGYFIEPVRIPIYRGIPFSKTLTDFLLARGYTYTYTGTVEKGFYLATVGGLDIENNRIPDGLWKYLEGKNYERSIEDRGTLGEFDFGSGSGWMYSVNGVYKNYGFSDYYPQDGDTVRVQFTLLLGDDLGGGGALGGGSSGSLLDDDPDYAPVMTLLADIAAGGADKTVYHEVLAALSEWNLSQKAMDALTEKLRAAYGR